MAIDAGTRVMRAKKKRQLITLGILATVIVIQMLRFWFHQPKPTMGDELKQSPNTPDTSDTPDTPASRQAIKRPSRYQTTQIPVTWPLEIHRNIFATQGKGISLMQNHTMESATIRQQALDTIKLQAIIFGQPPRAMINGQMWEQGEQVEGFVLQMIRRGRVILVKNGVEVEMRL